MENKFDREYALKILKDGKLKEHFDYCMQFA